MAQAVLWRLAPNKTLADALCFRLNHSSYQTASERLSLSLESLLRECYNTFLVRRLLSELGLEAEFGLTDPVVAQVLRVGRIGRMAA
jgi:hypothetical protein